MIPLSKIVEVPSVVEFNHRVVNPFCPPETPVAIIPKLDVETQRVEVPVDQRS